MKAILCVLISFVVVLLAPAKQILPGQVIVDNIYPHTLRKFGDGPIFICGPGDPEEFLYRGTLRTDGTRDGDQEQLIGNLAEHGGNCIYFQAVRSHGGDGAPDHNPFVENDPAKGLNATVLDQWEKWFQMMDEHNILIYFFIYDDSADPWRTGREVSEAERQFVTSLVDRFEHHSNLIWVVAEESEEALHSDRARAIGQIIRDADDHGHLVGNHHHSGTQFKTWTADGPFDHFAMQLNVPLEEVYGQAVEAADAARGKYQIIWAENTAIGDSARARRRFAWECAMGGLMPMLLQMPVDGAHPEGLRQCRTLSSFFELSQFQNLRPADGHAAGNTEHVMAGSGGAFIAYSSALNNDGVMALNNIPAGTYTLNWVDCQTGERSTENVVLKSDERLKKPDPLGSEVAVHLLKEPARKLVFPKADWERRTPKQVGMNAADLEAFAKLAGGRGVIIRDGYLVHTWGDFKKLGDLASASKPIYSHLLLAALDRDKLDSPDKRVSDYYPCLSDLNPDLGYKDRELTVRHLAFQTACLGYRERPGSAFDYNDFTMGLFWNVVMEKVYGVNWKAADTEVFDPLLTRPLRLQDGIHFPTSGRMAGRPRISPRDFARFGLLYLNGGVWGGKKILDPRLTRLAVTDPLPLTVPRTKGEEAASCATRTIGGGGNQTDHNGCYSWLWWLNGFARDGQRWWKDVPANTFAALGHCGQRGLAVFPDQRIIVSWNDTDELHCKRELGNRAFRTLLESVVD